MVATSGGLIISRPLLSDQIPTSSADLARVKYDVLHSLAYGVLVSPDATSALVTAGFNEGQVDYAEMHRRLAAIKRAVEDDNTVMYATGEPVLKAWCWYYKGELAEIFGVTGLFILFSLVLYFRRAYGVLLPIVGAAAQVIWGLGFLGLLGYNLDVLVLVIPLLVTARAASHGVQLLERYFEELERTGDRHQAVRDSMDELFLPGAIGILADAAGILVLGVATIPLVRKVAFFASFWGFSNIFTVLILCPVAARHPADAESDPALRSALDGFGPALGGRELHQPARKMGGVRDCRDSRGARGSAGGQVADRLHRTGIAAPVAGFRFQRFLAPRQSFIRRHQRAGDLSSKATVPTR